jgi:hypothetical protein
MLNWSLFTNGLYRRESSIKSLILRCGVATGDVAFAESHDLQQGHGLLPSLIGNDVHHDHFGFTILGDGDRLLLFGDQLHQFSGAVLHIGNGFNLQFRVKHIGLILVHN